MLKIRGGTNMHKYRVLDKERNQFLPTEGLLLAPNGVVYFNWVIQDTEKIEVQPVINLGDKALLDVYIGDALSVELDDVGAFSIINGALIREGFRYLPKKYDEIIIQFERTGKESMYYWLLFKLKGEFIKFEDVEGLSDVRTTVKRAIQSDSGYLLSSIVYSTTYSKIYDCTSPDWYDVSKAGE